MYVAVIKPIFDFIFAVLISPFLVILIILLAPIIYFDSPGPIFFIAERHGKNGKIFKLYKFRSMIPNAPTILNNDKTAYSSVLDARVTRFGHILRKTSIDELPQVINILKGDMSFIGPRPNLPLKEYDLLSEVEKRRLEVRPGITGYNQAFFRNSVSISQRYENDVYYVKNLSLFLDVKIFRKTLITVIKREKLYNN
jgi:lipopolysaccharide/colanic/teichoic acid biosynthesis glycosyltransferase